VSHETFFIVLDIALIASGPGAIAKIAKLKDIPKWYKGVKYAIKSFEIVNAAGNLTLNVLKDELRGTEYEELITQSNKVMLGICATQILSSGIKSIPKAVEGLRNTAKGISESVAIAFLKAFLKNEEKLLALRATGKSKSAEWLFKIKENLVKDLIAKTKNENLLDDLRKQLGLNIVKNLWKSFLDDAFVAGIKNDIIANTTLRNKFPTLSVDELTAIKVYTSDQVRNGTKIYQSLNTELRAGNLNDFNKGLNDLLNSGLSKMPKYSGEKIFRGVGKAEADIAKTWKVGDDITFKDFKSSSIKEEVAEGFMNRGGGDVIYEISNPKGYDICGISCFTTEGEIFFRSGSKFKVTELTYQPRFSENDPLIKVVKLTFIE
jgi:hypothetical protein